MLQAIITEKDLAEAVTKIVGRYSSFQIYRNKDKIDPEI